MDIIYNTIPTFTAYTYTLKHISKYSPVFLNFTLRIGECTEAAIVCHLHEILAGFGLSNGHI